MKKLIALVLTLVCLLGLVGCNKRTDTMYILGIVVDGVFYEKSYQPMPAEVDESAIIGYVKSHTETSPSKDGETNISKDLIGEPYAKVEGGIAVLYQNEWYLCTEETPSAEKTVVIEGTEVITVPSDIKKVEVSGYYGGGVIKAGDFVIDDFDKFAKWFSQLSLEHRTFEVGKNPGEMYAGGDSYTFAINDGALTFTYAIGGSPVTEYVIYDEEWYEVLNPSELPFK